MEIITNDAFIIQRRRLGTFFSVFGILVLLGGLLLSFSGRPDFVFYSLISLPAGWLISQVGLYFAHRFVRRPRPDEQLNEGLEKVAKDARLYHHVIPGLPHVILAPGGLIVIVAKYQTGKITVDGDKWSQKGIGLRRFFGQEGLGNPTLEAEVYLKRMAKYISRNIPELRDKEIPIGALIVFTTKGGSELDLKGSTIPAMHYTKLKGFWRQRKGDAELEPADYALLRENFDAKAGVDEDA